MWYVLLLGNYFQVSFWTVVRVYFLSIKAFINMGDIKSWGKEILLIKLEGIQLRVIVIEDYCTYYYY